MSKPSCSLSQFIEEFPLYVKFETDQPLTPGDLDNLAFNFFCKPENEVQPFRLEAASHGTNHKKENSPVEFTEIYSGVCQSCLQYRIAVVINADTQKDKPKYFVRK